jgi:CheY-like chemotaxis protein
VKAANKVMDWRMSNVGDGRRLFRPNVALIDIGLPKMNGYELAERLQGALSGAALRLVALTGYGQVEDRERAQAAGFDDYLVKPVDMPALERVLAGLPGI